MGFGAIPFFFCYIPILYFMWTNYDWNLYVDNPLDNPVEFAVNNETYSIPPKTYQSFDFRSPNLSISYKGEIYPFEKSGKYVCNISNK